MENPKLYMQQKNIPEAFDISFRTVISRLKELRELADRYGKSAVIDDGNLVLVNTAAFADYMANRQQLLDKNMRKYVEPFDAAEVRSRLGLDDGKIILYQNIGPSAPEPDHEKLKNAVREVLMEGLRAG